MNQIQIGDMSGYRNEGHNFGPGYSDPGLHQNIIMPPTPMTEYVNNHLAKAVAQIAEQVSILENVFGPVLKKQPASLSTDQIAVTSISVSSDLRNNLTALDKELQAISQRIAHLISRVDL